MEKKKLLILGASLLLVLIFFIMPGRITQSRINSAPPAVNYPLNVFEEKISDIAGEQFTPVISNEELIEREGGVIRICSVSLINKEDMSVKDTVFIFNE